MNLQGQRFIPAAPQQTWDALNDPETLKACIAGCESLERVADNEYLATLALRIGPVNARFKGRLELQNIVPIRSYSIVFDGQGGVAGFGKGSADVRLTPQDAGTLLEFTAEARVGGKLAQVGSRLIDAAASKIADDFFTAFETRLTLPTATAESLQAGDAASRGTSKLAGMKRIVAMSDSPGVRWVAWVAVAAGAIALLIYLAS